MFIGRELELEAIKEILSKKSASLMVYGKRKVGKTTLLMHGVKQSKDKNVYYECIKAPLGENLFNFVKQLKTQGIIAEMLLFDSWQDVFSYLNTLEQTYNIIIDEYPYLKKFEKPEKVDSVFQSIIDNSLKNVRLFISGSHVGMMSDLLQENNALYGRFTKIINLKELNYVESAKFYKELPAYDKIATFAVFGGSPFVNSCINAQYSLKQNVVNTVLNPMSAVYSYAENLLLSDFSGGNNVERILFSISNGKKRHNEIEQKLGMTNNGLLSKQLKVLLDMDIISKNYPINAKTDKKKTRYEINDNLLRFYYTFVYPNKSTLLTLGASAFYDAYILPTLTTFISHRFEEICKTYFSLLVKKGVLKGVLDIGTYYYDDSVKKQNGEFDVVLKTLNGYQIYDAKFLTTKLSEKEMLAEEQQVLKIPALKVEKIGFITVSGVEKTIDKFNYVTQSDLYFIN